jgi:hypothetical protein
LSNIALKRNAFSVFFGTITQVLPSTRTTSREKHFTQNQGEAEVLTG